MNTHYIIRPADPQHLDRLPAIERDAATRFGDSLPDSVLSHVTPRETLEAAQAAGLLWVALAPDGAPIGFAAASMRGPRMHLEELDVLPELGRKGVGSALVHAAERHARDSGCTEIALTTFRDVPWNAPFYERMGFSVIPEPALDAELSRRLSEEGLLGLERSRRVAMRKMLDRPTSV